MSLDLDPRRRAMLAEIGVTCWWPEPADEASNPSTVPAAPVRATAPARVPAPTAPLAPMAEAAPSAPRPRPAAAQRLVPAVQPVEQAPATPGARAGIAALDWSTLQQTVAGCRACTLCETRRNTVFGVGQAGATPDQAPQVDWMVVGEAPGENEDLQGEPFVGAAGKLLDNMLKALGVSRSHGVYIANVLKCRPPGNRNPTPEEMAQCTPFLQRQIALLRPRVILAVGRFAVQALLADSVPDVHTTPLGRLRGRVYHYQGVPVIVTYHPAYLLRSLPEKAKAWADLCLALRVLNTPPQVTSDPA